MCYYIGILGNSLGTSGVLIAEDGTFQKRAKSKAGMEWRDGRHGSAALAARQVVGELAEQQGLPFSELLRASERITIAMPGLDPRHSADRFLGQLSDHMFNPATTKISSIAEAAYAGAFQCQPGLLIRTGHGASAFFRTSAGKTQLVGDWGQLFGDHGSASWLGKKALQAITRVRDGRATDEEIKFGESIAQSMFNEGIDEGERWFDLPFMRLEAAGSVEYGLGVRKYLTEVGKLTARLAESGDPVASKFVEQAQRHLLEMVQEPVRRCAQSGEKLPVCIRGSLAEDSSFFRSGLLDLLLTAFSGCVQPKDGLNGVHSSVVGIGLLALDPETSRRSQLSGFQATFVMTAGVYPWSEPSPRFIRKEPASELGLRVMRKEQA